MHITKVDNGMECLVERFNDQGVCVERLCLKSSGAMAREAIDTKLASMQWDEKAEWGIRK